MRTDRCTSQVIAGRLAKAEEFLENAELLADDEPRRNAASSLFVNAEMAKHLRRLLVNRSRVTYSAQGLPVSEFTKIQRSAVQLVAAAKEA